MIDYMGMEDYEQKIRQIIYIQLSIAESKRLYGNVIMDWRLVRRALEEYLLPSLTDLVAQFMEEKEESIRELREENRRLQAQINQMSFTNNPLRDQKIIELFKEGLPKAEIARTVGMSRQGLVKAFKRLQLDGSNSVATSQVSP
jgi:CRP-like cAMP-binding protein